MTSQVKIDNVAIDTLKVNAKFVGVDGKPLSEDNTEELLTLLGSFLLNRPPSSHLNCLINLIHQIDRFCKYCNNSLIVLDIIK